MTLHLFSVLFAATTLAGPQGPWSAKLAPILERSKIAPGSYGVEIRSLADGKLLYSANADRGFNPASTIKVLTAATSLSKFGPNHRFQTTVLRSGNDLCLKGGGDPWLVNETMWNLVEEVRRAGVHRIKGDLVADESLFPTSMDHSEEFEGDSDRAFTASASALSANFNSLTINVEPGNPGKTGQVSLDPPLSFFDLKNRTRTSSNGEATLGAKLHRSGEKIEVVVSGAIPAGRKRVTLYRSVADPPRYAAHLFVEHFRRAGDVLEGKIRVGSCPENAQEILKFDSVPLSMVVFGLLKFSNNFIADMLVRNLGEEHTVQSGLGEIRRWLTSVQVGGERGVLENGSGLSRETRISAASLVAALRGALNDFRFAPEFLAALPISGTDGTFRRRLKNSDASAQVRAKSGQISGVVSLAGVAQTHSGQVVFAFLFNDVSGRESAIRDLEDRLLEKIVSF